MESKKSSGGSGADRVGASRVGVVLMTYGSATTTAGVRAYMEHIYKGKASEELITDFENRYKLVGHSPLVEITGEQAKRTEKLLATQNPAGDGSAGEQYIVRAAMLHSNPFIGDVVKELASQGVTHIRGIILSPQFSSFIMEGYKTALLTATRANGFADADVSVAGPWPDEPHFIDLLVSRVETARAELHKKYGANVPVLFTTHSLPQRVVQKDPNYLKELAVTIDAVVERLNDPTLQWTACYQSAGHTPEEWLKPDLADVLKDLGKRGSPAVLIVPIQFLADHLEILYDLDIAGGEQCREAGVEYHRIALPNTDPLFIQAMASLAIQK